MAGLFSLGGGGGGRGSSSHHNPNPEIHQPETLFWYKQQNDEVSSYPNLELWNQQQQQQQEQQHEQQLLLHNIPLLNGDLYSPLGVGSINVSGDHSSSRSGFMSCEDCGNQAKKDCPHMRCRTCCKSRGYECKTHLKSTWVPASKRRERQQQQQQQQREISKRTRHVNDNNIPNTSSAIACTYLPSEGLEQVNFPAVVSSPAEFRCVRVISMDNAVDKYAYQTAVNIGGHVFKGILYHQGPDNNNDYIFGESSSTGVAGVQHLKTATAIRTAPIISYTGALVDPSFLYSAPLYTGTQFFPHTRP